MSEPGYSSNTSKRETSKLPPKSVSTSRENMRTSTANLSRMSTHRASYHETRSSVNSSSKENVKENSRSREAVSSSTKKR